MDDAKKLALQFSRIEENSETDFSNQSYNVKKETYELEYSYQKCDYYCKIGVKDGVILEYEFDGVLPSGKTFGAVLGQGRIREILLTIDETIDEATVNMQLDKYDDDGQMVYEGTAQGERFNYEYEFQITSGIIVQWKTYLNNEG